MDKKAIKISLTKAPKEYDYGASKFFGAPTLPREWEDRFDESVIFFAQIRLEDIVPYDKENRLPHTGYLYFFIDTACDPYEVWIEHYDGEPDMLVEDFNELVPEFSHLNQAFLMAFSLCDEGADGTRLFGVPSSGYEEDDGTPLLLQFDPLDEYTGFLDSVDGYAYIFYDTEAESLDGASELTLDLVVDYS